MSEPKDLIEQLRRSNRKWKALALAACGALVLAAVFELVAVYWQRVRAEAQLQAANAALARAQMATNPGQPR
jgi:hypothetical protein